MASAAGALPSLDDPVERRSIHDQIADDGKGGRTPRLEGERVPVLEEAHGELADGGAAPAPVRHAVDEKSARSADPLAAVVLEGDGRFIAAEELFVELVEHLEEGHVGRHVLHRVRGEAAGCLCVLLPPDPEREIHGYL